MVLPPPTHTKCKWTIIHPNDSSDARSNLAEFNAFARKHDLDIMVAASPAAAKEMLNDIGADIGFVCGWYWLLDATTLAKVPHGLWGIHNSLLPKYRGGAPLVWSILNGDETVGSTVFRITEGMDDGEILCQVSTRLESSQDVSDALFLIEEKLVDALPVKWGELLNGNANLSAQNEDLATYCGQRIESDGLIDWRMKASSILNFIRAQAPPYPGAYSWLGSDKVVILKAAIVDEIYFGTPGQILRRNERSVIVSCGDNTALEIQNIRVAPEHESIPTQIIKSVKDRFSSEPKVSRRVLN